MAHDYALFVVSVWHRQGQHVPADTDARLASASQEFLLKKIM